MWAKEKLVFIVGQGPRLCMSRAPRRCWHRRCVGQTLRRRAGQGKESQAGAAGQGVSHRGPSSKTEKGLKVNSQACPA